MDLIRCWNDIINEHLYFRKRSRSNRLCIIVRCDVQPTNNQKKKTPKNYFRNVNSLAQ